MIKRCLFHFSLLLLFATNGFAQVNLQSGSATVSLPIFNWQDNYSRLNSAIALSYNSGNGLQVNEIASNVGQGWSLMAGGVITRMQVGLPDDQVARNVSDNTKYPPGILYATEPAYKGCPLALTKYPLFRNKNQKYTQHNVIAEDKELDFFAYQFNGKSGIFVLDPTNLGVAQHLGDTKMKITFVQDGALQSQGIRTKITSFAIQDVDGLIYKFSKHGLTKVLESNYCDANLSYLLTQPKFKPDKVFHQSGFENSTFVNPSIVSSWYLKEIEDPLTLRKIIFNYDVTRNINTIAGEDITYNKEKNYTIIYHKRSITQTPALTSIAYPDGHTATFNFAGTQRIDFPGEYAIQSIDVTYFGRYLSKHELKTTYIMRSRYGTPVTAYQQKIARLYLTSVRKIGVDLKDDSPPYLFDYYTGSGVGDDFVPPRYFYAKDIWGFYNGSNSEGYWQEVIPLNTDVSYLSNNMLRGLCFMKTGVTGVILNAKSGLAKNGLLRQIIYPTGGTLTYEYEQNTGVIPGSSVTTVGGVHVSMTKSTDGGFSNGCDNEIKTKYDYVLEGGASSLWGLELPVNSTFTTSHYEPEERYWKVDWNCPFSCCEWRFKYPGIMLQQQAISLSAIQTFLENAGPVFNIVSIIGIISDIVKFIDKGNPVGLIIDIIVALVQLGVTCVGNQARDNDYTTYYNFDLNSASPLPTQFKRVEIIENPGLSPGIGKTIQTFTSNDDYHVWVGAGGNPNFTSKQRFASWAYGLPKLTTVKDASGNRVKETEYIYDTTKAKTILVRCPNHPGIPCNSSGLYTDLVSCKCVVIKNTSQNTTDWYNSSLYNSTYLTSTDPTKLKVDFYAMYTGRTELKTMKERIYKSNDPSQFVETITDYLYNYVYNYEPYQISTQRSDGDVNIKFIRYTSDFSGGLITTLKQNNIIALPVSTSTQIFRPGVFMKYLDEKVTDFVQVASGDIKPYRILEQRFSQPVLQINFTGYQGPGSSLSNYKTTQTFTYDGSGKLIGVKDEGNRLVTNLYGYNDKYIVASVINADAVLDKCSYASFEETSTWTGWSLSGSTSYNANISMTGSRSFNLSTSTSFSSNLNTSKAYTLSFWSTTYGVTLSGGATLIKSSPTINGFTYFEYDIAQGTSGISLSGNAVIDELRLYPRTARMRSVAYDPLIGKTVDCDENNRITYYDYDNLGRLRFMKDENRNIIKMYEYNNISPSKQNGCPAIYYNKYISEIFIKDCGPGYLPDTIVYNVAANLYSSAISQADADAQAENHLLTNGQTIANTTGICRILHFNDPQFQNFTTETCAAGYTGGIVTYSVPANRYSSPISKDEANQMALDEIESNGQAYANDPAHMICNYNSNPVWESLNGASSYCQNGHLFVLLTDINPNSSSYNSTMWVDVGPDDSCPPPGITLFYANNSSQVQYITMTNVSTSEQYFFYAYAGLSGILGDVPEGTYNIEINDGLGYYWYSYQAECGHYTSGYSANFYNVSINSSCYNITIFQ